MYPDKSMPVSELMTTDVFFVRPDDTLMQVSDIFNSRPIHHLPVIDEAGFVKGILSKSDFLRLEHGLTIFKTEKSAAYNQAVFSSLLVEEVMTRQVVMLKRESTLKEAADIFQENLFHAMPVVDETGKLAGMLSTYDLLKHAYRDEVLISSGT